MRNRESGPRLNNNRPESKNIYVKSEMMSADGEYVYAEPDINEWEPAELDIFLL
jgi:hypothetical protein